MALVARTTGYGIAAHACAGLASVRLCADVPIIARGTVSFRRIRTDSGGVIAGASGVALIERRAENRTTGVGPPLDGERRTIDKRDILRRVDILRLCLRGQYDDVEISSAVAIHLHRNSVDGVGIHVELVGVPIDDVILANGIDAHGFRTGARRHCESSDRGAARNQRRDSHDGGLASVERALERRL
jgi:hypothetical protein